MFRLNVFLTLCHRSKRNRLAFYFSGVNAGKTGAMYGRSRVHFVLNLTILRIVTVQR